MCGWVCIEYSLNIHSLVQCHLTFYLCLRTCFKWLSPRSKLENDWGLIPRYTKGEEGAALLDPGKGVEVVEGLVAVESIRGLCRFPISTCFTNKLHPLDFTMPAQWKRPVLIHSINHRHRHYHLSVFMMTHLSANMSLERYTTWTVHVYFCVCLMALYIPGRVTTTYSSLVAMFLKGSRDIRAFQWCDFFKEAEEIYSESQFSKSFYLLNMFSFCYVPYILFLIFEYVPCFVWTYCSLACCVCKSHSIPFDVLVHFHISLWTYFILYCTWTHHSIPYLLCTRYFSPVCFVHITLHLVCTKRIQWSSICSYRSCILITDYLLILFLFLLSESLELLLRGGCSCDAKGITSNSSLSSGPSNLGIDFPAWVFLKLFLLLVINFVFIELFCFVNCYCMVYY